MKCRGVNAHNKYIILKHALKGNNISQTCELFGISRTTFYKWKRAYQKYGMVGLECKEPKKPQMPNKVSKEIEQEILTYVIKYPTDGPKRIYYELRAEGIDVGETGVYNVLKRNDLTKRAQRLIYSKNKKINMKTKANYSKEEKSFAKSQDAYPGYLVIQRIDFMGTYDGIGRIYQYSIYDTSSTYREVKLYNKKQDIDVWHHFELKLAYLLKVFNLSIENLITVKERTFLPYFVKGTRYKEIIEDFNINHVFIAPEESALLDDTKKFNEFLTTEFYNKIGLNSGIDSFAKVDRALNKFMRTYNFQTVITSGSNSGKTPVEVILERAAQNNVDFDTLPLWILALINSSKRGDTDE